MIRIVSVKFRTAGKNYDFNAHQFDLKAGTRVVVETDRGRSLGTVVEPPREVPAGSAPGELKSVLRPATDEDLALASVNTAREGEAFRFCAQRIQERRMEMKLVRAEYLFDGSKIIFYFTADGRVDFRELVKDLAHHFHTRIEMRQIGVRDEAKLTGGIGVCGRELCCCTFLTEFAPVSVKMAKEQGLALNPNKISGQCGRLLCCLGYEFETYCSLRKALPKCGRKVAVGDREGEVIDQNILAQKVRVRMEDGQAVELTAEQLEKGLPPEPPASLPIERRREERPARRESERRETPRPATTPAPRAEPAPPRPEAPPAPAATEAAPGQGKRRRHRGRRRPKQKPSPGETNG